MTTRIRAVAGAACACAILAVSVAPSAASANSQIVFSRFKGNTRQLVVAQPNGNDLHALTHPKKNQFDIDAQFSPDGTQVAFERDIGNKDSQLRLVGSDGQNERVIDFGCVDPCAVDIQPTWTRAGDRLLFTRVVGPFDAPGHSARSAVLHSAMLDGSDVKRISGPGIDGVYEDYYGRYAPDSSYLVATRIRNKPFNSAVFRMNVDGTGAVQLTPWKLDADLADLSPATDGATKDMVAFETYGHVMSSGPEGVSSNVATVPATCVSLSECREQIQHITHHHGGEAMAFNPTWSPDGRQIAYTKFSGGDKCCVGDIWRMRPDGSHKRPVSQSTLFEYRPDWGIAP